MTTDTPVPVDPADVKTVRRFNRFYTRQAGVLEPYLGSDLSLTEVRVLYELAHHQGLTVTELSRALGLDTGYLSRLLKRFSQHGWLVRLTNPQDARQGLLGLTPAGHAAFAPLQQKSRDAAAALLAPLSMPQRTELTAAMKRIEQLLDPAAPAPRTRTVVLREPAPGGKRAAIPPLKGSV